MERTRNIEFDFLRSIIIVSAFIQHYNAKIHIGFIAFPSEIVQKFIFTVGGFFFFTAGFMARNIYLQKFIDNPKHTSKKIFLKGAGIFFLYLLYVLLMHVFTGTELPSDLLTFIYGHKFYVVVLFTFAILYVSTPLILYGIHNYPKISAIFIFALIMVFLLYDQKWPIPFYLKKIFLDRSLFLYPIIPAMIVYAAGYMAAISEKKFTKRVQTGKFAITSFLVVLVHLILLKETNWYVHIVRNNKCFTLIEAVTPYFFLIIARYISSIQSINKYISSPYLLSVGVFSLHFYVISNLLLGLLSITKESDPVIKLIGLVGTGCLAYIFTFWRYRATWGAPLVNKSA